MSAAYKANCPGAAGQGANQITVRKPHFIALHRIKQAIQIIAFSLVLNMPLVAILFTGVHHG